MTERVGVGEALREAREARGLSIEDVALQLKFAPRQIESLENERFDRLPGPTIARGMVRNYARLLKLDPEPLVERMAPHIEHTPLDPTLAAGLRQPVPFSDGGKRSTLMYATFSVGILVLAVAVVAGWQQERATTEFVAPLQVERTEPGPPPPVVQPVAAPPAPLEEKTPSPSKDMALEEKQPEPELERALPPGMHRIVLRTEEEAWLEVRDGAGRSLISSLNPAGSERSVRGRPPFELVIGNASRVTLTYDGKQIDLEPHTRGDVARLTLK